MQVNRGFWEGFADSSPGRDHRPFRLARHWDEMMGKELFSTVILLCGGPACFGIAFLIGKTFHFDGQSALLVLPLVLGGWCCSLVGVGVGIGRSLDKGLPIGWRLGVAAGALLNLSVLASILI